MVAGGPHHHRPGASPSPSPSQASSPPPTPPAVGGATEPEDEDDDDGDGGRYTALDSRSRRSAWVSAANRPTTSNYHRVINAITLGPEITPPLSSRLYSAAVRKPSNHRNNRDGGVAAGGGAGGASSATGAGNNATTPPVHPSMLQPRVAVVLNVPPIWHPWLFALRLLSCLPAIWWGLPSALHLLLRFRPGPAAHGNGSAFSALHHGGDGWSEPYALTETTLATIWCFACGYLSFFFTDCLMSRWLINYTPQATIVRLLTIDVINAYITLTTLSLCGGFQDPRLLLPGWIGIATTLTVCYHISHQRINIRKETSTSVNVFSIASYLSMVALLAHILAFQPDYPTMPVVAHGRRFWQDALHRLAQIQGTIERERAEL